MSAARDKFLVECGYCTTSYYSDRVEADPDALVGWGDALPCYGMRISVNAEVNTPERIKSLIRYGKQYAAEGGEGENMFIFSVTKRDGCWQAWVDFAKENPNVFAAVVQTTSRHDGHYPVRMYVVVKKPRTKR